MIPINSWVQTVPLVVLNFEAKITWGDWADEGPELVEGLQS